MKTPTLDRLPLSILCRSAILCIFLAAAATRAAPPTIQYQGYLTDADNQAIDAVLDMVFRLYNDPDPAVAPIPLWEEFHADVPVAQGRITVTLGEVTPFAEAGITFDDPLFLEVEVSSAPLLPRITLHSVPYALKASGVVPEGVTSSMLAAGAVTAGKVHVTLAGEGLGIDESGALKIETAGVTADMVQSNSLSDRHIAPDAAIDPEKIGGTAVTLNGVNILENKTLDADLNTVRNLDLDAFRPGVILDSLGSGIKAHDTLATAEAVIAYVEAANGRQDALAELTDTTVGTVDPGQLLVAGNDGLWQNRALAGDLSLASDGTVSINANAVELGADTSGDYLAGIVAGAGLGGGGTGEAATPAVFVNVDGSTIRVASDALELVPGGILAAHLGSAIDVSDKGFKAYEAVVADQVDGTDVDDTSPPSPAHLWTSARVADHVDDQFAMLPWRTQVLGFADTLPDEAFPGDRFIAAGVPGWNAASIYTFDGTVWHETIPLAGFTVWVTEEVAPFAFDGEAWVSMAPVTDHGNLDNLQGGDGTAFYHLSEDMHHALNVLQPNRLLAADGAGRPIATEAEDWIQGSTAQIAVVDNGDGSVTLSLPQTIDPSSTPSFAGITIAGATVHAISNDPALAAASTGAVPTEAAVKAYVDGRDAAMDTLAELTDTQLAGASSGSLLQFDGESWLPTDQVAGEFIELLPGGGLDHGSGLYVNVDDLTLRITGNQLHVSPRGIGEAQLAPDIDASGKGFLAAAAVEADRVDGADVDDGSAPDASILWSSAKISEFIAGLINGLDWASPVQRFASTIPPAPETGQRVIADGAPGWNTDSIYEFDGTVWHETVATEGLALWVEDEDRNYVFNGTEWVTFGSTQNHAALQGLQGGGEDQRYHLSEALYNALTGLTPMRLLAADETGLPAPTALDDWLDGTANQITVTDGPGGSAVLSLPQDIDIAAHPLFSELSLTEALQLAGRRIEAISTDSTFTSPNDLTLATQAAVKAYVDTAVQSSDALSEMDDTNIAAAATGDLLQFDGTRWVNISTVPGDLIDLAYGGGLTHGSGLMLDLSNDGTLVINGNKLGVGMVGADHIEPDAIELGTHTMGDYVAAITTGNGLLGGTSGEATRPQLSVHADGITIVFDESGRLGVDGSAVDAGTVCGAALDDAGGPAPDILWSSEQTGAFSRGLFSPFDWQESVIAIGQPGAEEPLPDDRYIAPALPAAKAMGWLPGWIYQFDGDDWLAIQPDEGFAVWIDNEDRHVVFDGSTWIPLEAAQDHEALAGLQGGAADQHFHLDQLTYQALTGITPSRLLASNDQGLPEATVLETWVQGASGQIVSSGNAHGGVTLALHDHVPVALPAADAILMGTGESWNAVPQTAITRLGTIAHGIWQGTPIDGQYIRLAEQGGIMHGSGLMLDLADDGSLVIDTEGLRVGRLGSGNLEPDSVTLGTQTTGDYVATLTAGAGLSGDGIGETSNPTLDLNVDGQTVTIAADVLGVRDNGIGLAQLATGIDASSKSFKAATAVDADRVDGADVDDAAAAAAAILWSSAKIKDYVDAMLQGLDWQESVAAVVSSIPSEPDPGLRVISNVVPRWTHHAIYEFNGDTWTEIVPNEGFSCWVEADNRNLVFNGSKWVTLGSTQIHNALLGLQGGDVEQYYHLDQALYDALNRLAETPGKLLAADALGLPTTTQLGDWVRGAAAEILVSSDSDGGVTLSLDSQIPKAAPASGAILMGNGSTWTGTSQTEITSLGTIAAGTWEATPIDGAYISLAPQGGLTHGSGLKLNLNPADPSILVDANNYVTLNEVTGEHVVDGSLSGDDIADHTLGTPELLNLPGPGAAGQPLLADGLGGFQFGEQPALGLAQGTSDWTFVRDVLDALVDPRGITQDDRGCLYVADAATSAIRVFGPYGAPMGWFGKGSDSTIGFHPHGTTITPVAGSEPGAFAQPMDVAFMRSIGSQKQLAGRYLWVADTANNRVQLIDLDDAQFAATAFSGSAIDPFGLNAPSGVAAFADKILIADTGQHRVVEMTYYSHSLMPVGWYGYDGVTAGFFPAGQLTQGPPTAGNGDSMFDAPHGLAIHVDPDAPVFAVADTGNYRVCIFDLFARSFVGWIGAGSEGSSGWHAPGGAPTPVPGTQPGQFQQPEGVALGADVIAVSDAATNLISIFTAKYPAATKAVPTYLAALGGTGTGPGQCDRPTGMTRDRDGSLWVCDSNNARIQKFAPPHVDPYAVLEPENGNVVFGGDIPMPSVAFQVEASDAGILIPRLDPGQMLDISNPQEGLLVYNYGSEMAYKSDPAIKGFFFWNGYEWERVGEIGYGDVGSDEIAYGAVQSWHIGWGQVDTDQLATGAVTGEKIGSDTISDDKLLPIERADLVRPGAVQKAPGGGLVADANGLAVDRNAFVATCPQIVLVGPGESIQAAISSITDASADNPYLIKVAPGVYREKLTLISHVDIEGAGIGKTVIQSDGGAQTIGLKRPGTRPAGLKAPGIAATVQAANVTNAGIRHLTIEATRDAGTYDLVGLYYDGSTTGSSLRLLHVAIEVNATGAGISGDAWGIGGPTSPTSGLELHDVTIDVDVLTGSTYTLHGIEWHGDLTMTDSTVSVRSPNNGVQAVGIGLTNPGQTVTLQRNNVRVDALGLESKPCAAFIGYGSGESVLMDCTLTTTQDNNDGLAVNGPALVVKAKRCALTCTSASTTPLGIQSIHVINGRVELYHCDVTSENQAVKMEAATVSELMAYFCTLQGTRDDRSASRATYVRCADLDLTGNPTGEIHSTLP